ncbi:hypothetical protein SAMN04487948_10915 [Halogranum amylolyticum]|uniref:Uncharacterized protein n=1 Tax=Halogranum amylolyticum TaxID=660520 RepID=A0A1H8U035_9EURY|nr:hypothetical protein SAMN04487948_10915 [Halogranum amylolyticum]
MQILLKQQEISYFQKVTFYRVTMGLTLYVTKLWPVWTITANL